MPAFSAIDALSLPTCSSSDKSESNQQLRKVFLTGSTGYVGSMILRDILVHREQLSIKGVVLLCRGKKGKSARERMADIMETSLFSFLNPREKCELIEVFEGDCSKPNLGLSSEEKEQICRDSAISHVIHSAAAVSFTQPLEKAAKDNISSTLNLQSLTKSMSHPSPLFVHVSTAFVHGGLSGTESGPLPQRLYKFGPYDPKKLYESMLGDQKYAKEALKYHQFPNTYTFSKSICEHLLMQQSSVRTIIVRPSIVGPSWREPFEGWAGEKPSTIVAATCLYLRCQFNLWSPGNHSAPYIPVDVVARFVLAKAFDPAHSTSDNRSIYTAAWDTSSHPNASLVWSDHVIAMGQYGSAKGYFHWFLAAVRLFLIMKVLPVLGMTRERFELLHNVFVRAPIVWAIYFCNLVGYKPQGLTKLFSVLDLPLLFYHFMNKRFHFRSELVAPASLSGERYMFSCLVAADQFLAQYQSQQEKQKDTDPQ